MAEERREVHPRDPTVLSHLAACYAALGERSRAESIIAEAMKLAPTDVVIMIQASAAYELLGSRDKALHWVRQALDQGYPLSQINSLPEFQELCSDSQFVSLLQDMNLDK